MPNRLIREGLMESEKVLSLPVEARWLFVIVMLSADDVGLFEATEFKLARRADVNRDLAGKLMQMIADVDLVRLYLVEGKRYGFIPKFRQKLTIKRSKHPWPPEALLHDDLAALTHLKAIGRAADGGIAGAFGKEWQELRERVLKRDGYQCIRCGSQESLTAHHLLPQSKGGEHTEDNLTTLCSSCNSWARNNDSKCNEIMHLALKTASRQHQDRISVDSGRPPEVEPEEKKISDASHPRQQRKAADRMPNCPYENIVRTYHEVLPGLPGVRIMDEARKKAIKALWTFVMTTEKSDGSRRATNAEQGLAWVRGYFTRVLDNDWLMGRTTPKPGHETWRCTLDFLCSGKGLKAVIERTEHAA